MSKLSYSQILKKENTIIEEEEEQLIFDTEEEVKNICLKYPYSNSLYKKSFMLWRNTYSIELEELYGIVCNATGIDIDRKKFFNIMYRCSE
jgi:hypothetical protein